MEHRVEAVLAVVADRHVRSFFQALAACSQAAGLIRMIDSTAVRAHVSAAGAKGGSKIRRSAVRAAGSARKSTSNAISTGYRSTFV